MSEAITVTLDEETLDRLQVACGSRWDNVRRILYPEIEKPPTELPEKPTEPEPKPDPIDTDPVEPSDEDDTP